MRDEEIRHILMAAKNIVIVGLSPDETKASNNVAKFLQSKGYKIFPVYPKENEILNCKVYRNLEQILDKIDIVVMFRKGEFADELLKSIIKKDIKTLWLQLDIVNESAKLKAEQSGINFIQNRCIKIEWQRLFDKKSN